MKTNQIQSLLHMNGIMVNNDQAGRFALYAASVLHKAHGQQNVKDRYACLSSDLEAMFTDWKNIAGPETVLACFVEPIDMCAEKRAAHIEMLVKHDLLTIYLASNDTNAPEHLIAPNEVERRIPLSFDFQPTKADVCAKLLAAVNPKGVDHE